MISISVCGEKTSNELRLQPLAWGSAPWPRGVWLSGCSSTGWDKLQKDSPLRKFNHRNWRRPINFSFFLFLTIITVFQIGNNQSTFQQTPLRYILSNWKLFNPLTLRRSHLKFFCATVWPVSSGGQGTLAWEWEFKLQYHPAARIILQKTKEMDRDPLFPYFLRTKRYEGTLS